MAFVGLDLRSILIFVHWKLEMNGPSCLISRWDGWDDPGKIHSLNLKNYPIAKGNIIFHTSHFWGQHVKFPGCNQWNSVEG